MPPRIRYKIGANCHDVSFTPKILTSLTSRIVMSSNIIDLTYSAFADDQINSDAVVFYVEPVTHILPFAIDRDFLIVQDVGNNQRNQFLWEMIWPVIV